MKEYGLKFKGTANTGVIIPTPNSILKPINSLSVSAFVYIDDNVFSKLNNFIVSCTQNGGYVVSINHSSRIDSVSLWIYSGGYKTVTFHKSELIYNEFNYIVGTFDGETLNIYLNGDLKDTVKFKGSISYANNAICIGNDPDAGNSFDTANNYGSNTIISNVSIWDKCLNESEIKKYYKTKLTGNEKGLVGYWDFKKINGDVVSDLTGNGNNGTIYNADLVEANISFNRYLIKSNNMINTVMDNSLIYPNIKEPLTKDDFSKYGITNLSSYSNEINKVFYEMEEGIELEDGYRVVRKKINKNDFKINRIYTSKIDINKNIAELVPEDRISSSSVYSTWYDYKAFDGNLADSAGWQTANGVPQWIQLDFERPISVYKIIIYNYYNNRGVKNFILQGSNNGIDFVDIFSDIAEEGIIKDPIPQNFYINDTSKYRFIRLLCSDNYGANNIGLKELEIYEWEYNKYLIKSNNKIYTIDENNIIKETHLVEPLVKEDFDTYGVSNISYDNLIELDDEIEIIAYGNEDEDEPDLLLIDTDPFKPIDMLNDIETFEILTYSENHNIYPEFSIEYEEESNIKYCISKDNKNTWWVFRDDKWTNIDLNDIYTEGMSKDEFESISSPNWIRWFERGTIDLAIGMYSGFDDTKPSLKSITFNFTENQAPLIDDPKLTPDTVHNEWVEIRATINDLEDEQVQYQIYINDKQVYPIIKDDWSPWLKSGHRFIQAYRHPDFIVGENIVKIKVRDGRLLEREWEGTVVVTNQDPYLVYVYDEYGITGTIGDDELDEVSFRISSNGNKLFDYLEMSDSPRSFHYNWKPKDLKYGISNNIVIETIDHFGGYSKEEFSLVGTYKGLLFKDENGNYYTSDKGEVLKMLNKGTLIAGQNTSPTKVTLVNNTNASLKNVKIIANKGNLPETADLKLSETSIFDPKDIIEISEVMANKEEKEFYVSVRSKPGRGVIGGKFNISSEAQIMEYKPIEYPDINKK